MKSAYAAQFAALGHPNRLELFRLLVQSGDQGLTIGEIATALGMPGSTLNFHLGELVRADMVVQVKEGRATRCFVNYEALNELLNFVKKDCCKGVRLSAFAN